MNIKLGFVINRVFLIMAFIVIETYGVDDENLLEKSLVKAYPLFLDSITDNVLIWKDKAKMVFDDGIQDKNFDTLLNSPDIEDQMSIRYPSGKNYQKQPSKNYDPGRIRYEPFFRKMYGNTEKEVYSKLVAVHWMPNTVDKILMVSSVNGINEKLKAISDELDKLPTNLKKYVVKTAGTFNWRKISGTNRLSTHSFGIAIDINIKYANYWKWDKPRADGKLVYKNQIPMEIVNIFEKHGFIWGGKWYHYDTMHFEYRPELLMHK